MGSGAQFLRLRLTSAHKSFATHASPDFIAISRSLDTGSPKILIECLLDVIKRLVCADGVKGVLKDSTTW